MTKLPRRDQMLHRFADADTSAAPISYDAKAHTFDATVSMGSPVKRFYGTEVLRVAPDAVDLSRLREGGIPLLDHHKQDGIDSMLGKLVSARFERGALVGTFKLNKTEQGQKAEGMVARGEVTGISAGYRVDRWEITDEDGDTVAESSIRWDDDLTFTATRWQLFEASLVGVPADAQAMVRSMSRGADTVDDIRARMRARHSIVIGHRRHG
jgi:HK97 family phage prohead protease